MTIPGSETIGAIGAFATAKIVMFFIITWLLLGLAAFIMSLVCISKVKKTGISIAEMVVGIFLAFVYGPFYWIYYYMSDGYCK
jgi:hypothetical protein